MTAEGPDRRERPPGRSPKSGLARTTGSVNVSRKSKPLSAPVLSHLTAIRECLQFAADRAAPWCADREALRNAPVVEPSDADSWLAWGRFATEHKILKALCRKARTEGDTRTLSDLDSIILKLMVRALLDNRPGLVAGIAEAEQHPKLAALVRESVNGTLASYLWSAWHQARRPIEQAALTERFAGLAPEHAARIWNREPATIEGAKLPKGLTLGGLYAYLRENPLMELQEARGAEEPKQQEDAQTDALQFSPGEVAYNGRSVALKGKPWEVTKKLAEANGRAVTRTALLNDCWDTVESGSDETVNSAICTARDALRDLFQTKSDPILCVERKRDRTAWKLVLPV